MDDDAQSFRCARANLSDRRWPFRGQDELIVLEDTSPVAATEPLRSKPLKSRAAPSPSSSVPLYRAMHTVPVEHLVSASSQGWRALFRSEGSLAPHLVTWSQGTCSHSCIPLIVAIPCLFHSPQRAVSGSVDPRNKENSPLPATFPHASRKEQVGDGQESPASFQLTELVARLEVKVHALAELGPSTRELTIPMRRPLCFSNCGTN